MSYVLQKKWTPHHPKKGWEWVLYAKDIEHNDIEGAAAVYADDRDGPFSLAIWSWIDEEYIDIEGIPTLKDAKAMGKLLASIEAAKT